MKLNIEELVRQTFTKQYAEELIKFQAGAIENLAELIVERCAQVCEQTEDGEGPDCWDWHSKDYARAIRNLMED